MRWGLKIGLPVVLLVILIGAVIVKNMARREGVTNRESQDPKSTPMAGLPQSGSALGNIPSEKEEKKMFPGVPWGNQEAAQSIMPDESTKVPSAPSAMLEQIMGYLQPLGAAPDLSIGDGSRVGSRGDSASVDGAGPNSGGAARAAAHAAGMMPVAQGEGGFQPGSYGPARGGHSGHGAGHASAQSALPHGIPHSKIPKGQEDLYILKSEIVPPVCPACPACPECPRPVCPKPDDSQCPTCPAPGRCPPSSFGCQRVPLYQSMNSGVLPAFMN